MRTAEEIVRYLRDNSDVFGFRVQALAEFLAFEEIKPLLKPGAKAEDWVDVSPRTEEAVKNAMRKYMDFAWTKVTDHRGISASRSVDKMEAWLWLLEDEKVMREFKEAPFENYGAPKLAVVCRAYDFPIPMEQAARNMIEGLPCEPDCCEGCGR